MPRLGFEPTISAGERPQTYALDRAAIGTGMYSGVVHLKSQLWVQRAVRKKSWTADRG